MLKNLFLSILNTIKALSASIRNLPSSAREQINKVQNDCSSLHYCLKNLITSNMDLGIYHLYKRNYRDAIFRFKLINIFLEPTNKTAYYWLGWAYFLQNNHKKAIISLTKAEEADKINLLAFVKSIDSATSIPDAIHQMHRDITADLFSTKFINDKINLTRQLVLELSNNISELPGKYSILELGSNVGLLSYELNKRMQDKYVLTSVEISNLMIKLQDTYFPKQKLYDEISPLPINSFLEKGKQKYNIICSMHGFAFASDLQNIFDSVFKKLQAGGYFAFAAKLSSSNHFSSATLEFAYNHEQLKDKLAKSGFKVLASNKFSLEIKNNYSIFVCTK